MKKKIKVESIGKPSLESLSEGEKTAFYTTLLQRIAELARGGK